MSDYPRESKEFVHMIVTVDGVQLTAADAGHLELCVTLDKIDSRPETWELMQTLGDSIGFLIGPGTTKDYSAETKFPVRRTAWCRDTDNPEIPVIKCGTFRAT